MAGLGQDVSPHARVPGVQSVPADHPGQVPGGVGTKPLIETAVEIALEFVRSYPKNLPKGEASRERRLKEALVRKPDLDNMVKAAIDGVKGTVLKDDTVVVRVTAEKRFGPEPMTVITVIKSEGPEEASPGQHFEEVS